MLQEIDQDNSGYKNKAIEILKKLYKKTPNIFLMKKIEELEKLN